MGKILNFFLNLGQNVFEWVMLQPWDFSGGDGSDAQF